MLLIVVLENRIESEDLDQIPYFNIIIVSNASKSICLDKKQSSDIDINTMYLETQTSDTSKYVNLYIYCFKLNGCISPSKQIPYFIMLILATFAKGLLYVMLL